MPLTSLNWRLKKQSHIPEIVPTFEKHHSEYKLINTHCFWISDATGCAIRLHFPTSHVKCWEGGKNMTKVGREDFEIMGFI